MRAIVQARLTSKRLPGKSLHIVNGKPLLQYVIEKVERVAGVKGVVVATSDQPEDNAIDMFCRELKIDCVRGPLDDVSSRFKLVLERFPVEAFVRISGDSPLIDPALITQAVAIYQSGAYDLVSNVVTRTFPKGQSVEIVRSKAFISAFRAMASQDEKEHVTPYFYRHAVDFRIGSFQSGGNYGDVQLSVDGPDDLARFKALIGQMSRPHWTYGWKELVEMNEQVKKKTS